MMKSSFNSSQHLKKMADPLCLSELIPIAFGSCDNDGDSLITAEEAGSAMRLLGLYVTGTEVRDWALRQAEGFDLNAFAALVGESLQK